MTNPSFFQSCEIENFVKFFLKIAQLVEFTIGEKKIQNVPILFIEKAYNLLKKNHSLHLCRVMGKHICTYIFSTLNPLLQFNVLSFLWV